MKPGSVYAFLAEHRKVLFPDQMFADLFPSGRGRPSVPADVMAAVIVLQPLRKLRYRPAPVVCSGRLAGSPRRRMFRPVLGWQFMILQASALLCPWPINSQYRACRACIAALPRGCSNACTCRAAVSTASC